MKNLRIIKDITESVGKSLDNLTTTAEEKMKLKNELVSITTEALDRHEERMYDILKAEAQGSGLQRSARPLTLLAFVLILLTNYMLAPIFGWKLNLDVNFWAAFNIILGSFVIGRSIERISATVTKNVDIPFIKRKNREPKRDE